MFCEKLNNTKFASMFTAHPIMMNVCGAPFETADCLTVCHSVTKLCKKNAATVYTKVDMERYLGTTGVLHKGKGLSHNCTLKFFEYYLKSMTLLGILHTMRK